MANSAAIGIYCTAAELKRDFEHDQNAVISMDQISNGLICEIWKYGSQKNGIQQLLEMYF